MVPEIIVERLLLEGKVPNDLKFHCINGKVRFIYVSIDREDSDVRIILDPDWKKMEMFWNPPSSKAFDHNKIPQQPSNLTEMIVVAEKLSRNWKYCRIDLYDVNGQVYFGEFTLFPHGGLEVISPLKFDEIFGQLVNT